MATTKPRITVTLSERQYALLSSMSANSGSSMSSFIHDLLEACEPAMERMASMFQALSEQKNRSNQLIAEKIRDAQGQFEPNLAKFLDQADLFLGNLEESVASVSPPATNRGVTKDDKSTKKSLNSLKNNKLSKRELERQN